MVKESDALDLLSGVNMAVARIYSTSITMREIESQFKKAVEGAVSAQKALLKHKTVLMNDHCG